MTQSQEEHLLVDYLLELVQRQDRGTLAALRSGVGKPPGEAVRMFPHVARFLRAGGADAPQVRATFLTASLFATHPLHAKIGNLGASLRAAVRQKHGEEGVTARLVAALDADPEDLSRHLTGLVGLCESAGVPIDWTRFYWDVYYLVQPHSDRRNEVRLEWARSFWAPQQADENETESQETQS